MRIFVLEQTVDYHNLNLQSSEWHQECKTWHSCGFLFASTSKTTNTDPM